VVSLLYSNFQTALRSLHILLHLPTLSFLTLKVMISTPWWEARTIRRLREMHKTWVEMPALVHIRHTETQPQQFDV
jgi:hypothetical protein